MNFRTINKQDILRIEVRMAHQTQSRSLYYGPESI